MLVKEDNNCSVLETFMSLHDNHIINIIKYDRDSLYMMCLALSMDMFDKENTTKYLAN